MTWKCPGCDEIYLSDECPTCHMKGSSLRRMTWKCQRKTLMQGDFHIHQVEAPDEATARVMMFNRSFSPAWLDLSKTNVWSDEDWTAA